MTHLEWQTRLIFFKTPVTLNQRVVGSNPTSPTKPFSDLV